MTARSYILVRRQSAVLTFIACCENIHVNILHMSCDSSVSKVTGYQLGSKCSVHGRGRNFSDDHDRSPLKDQPASNTSESNVAKAEVLELCPLPRGCHWSFVARAELIV